MGLSLRTPQIRYSRVQADGVSIGWPAARTRAPSADGRHRSRFSALRQERERQHVRSAHCEAAVDEKLLISHGPRPDIDPVRWRFCRFFGLAGEVHPSRLAESDFMKFVSQGMPSLPPDSRAGE